LIDTHCHLLWRIDDGPSTPMESMDLARVLVAQGVEIAVCTPHYSPRFPTRHEVARERVGELRRDLQALDVPLVAELAAEIHFTLALSVATEELVERSISGFLLVELERGASAGLPVLVLDRLRSVSLVPIFAHPERCPAVLADPAGLDEARAGGALIQVLASSLAGRRGGRVAQAAWSFLDAGRADVLATDAHGAGGTARRLRQTVDAVTQRYGSAVVDMLVRIRPAQVVGAVAPMP
jgi:protein-tyrosine phosphatase